MQLDVHSEIYPMRAKEKYRMLLSETLSLDGSASYPEVLFPVFLFLGILGGGWRVWKGALSHYGHVFKHMLIMKNELPFLCL